jgi:hypothetical protein
MEMLEMRPLPNETYQTYTPDTKATEARAAFIKRHGYEPEQVFFFRRLVWAGPVKGATK